MFPLPEGNQKKTIPKKNGLFQSTLLSKSLTRLTVGLGIESIPS
jgi:hypothetical protein